MNYYLANEAAETELISNSVPDWGFLAIHDEILISEERTV